MEKVNKRLKEKSLKSLLGLRKLTKEEKIPISFAFILNSMAFTLIFFSVDFLIITPNALEQGFYEMSPIHSRGYALLGQTYFYCSWIIWICFFMLTNKALDLLTIKLLSIEKRKMMIIYYGGMTAGMMFLAVTHNLYLLFIK
jgi:hypothetical protein